MVESGAFRTSVGEVAAVLRELHRTLLEVVRGDYERGHGPVGSPAALLRLVMYDPEFGWLHELSRLMVDVDELLDGKTVSLADAAAVRVEIERLLAPSEHGSAEFTRRYLQALQSDMDLVVVHGQVRKVLASLPVATDEELPDASVLRREWAERRRPATGWNN
jgi:hypothetical protein